MVMLPLFEIQMPSNAGIFMKQVMEIASFDFFDFSDIVHQSFSIEVTGAINDNFEQIGFESEYFLVNMGTMMVFYFIYITCFIVSPIIRKMRGLCTCCNNISNSLDSLLYWRVLITLINETYMIIIVCLLLNIQAFSVESIGLANMSLLCAVFLLLSILLPTIFIKTLNKHFN